MARGSERIIVAINIVATATMIAHRTLVSIDDLPVRVRDFVGACIDSVEQIAILMLLRADPARTWTAEAISAELRSAASAIDRRLEHLYAERVLARPTGAGIRFVPASPEMARAIDELVEAYRDRPNRIIELIYSKPPATSLQAFAEAFKLKKEK